MTPPAHPAVWPVEPPAVQRAFEPPATPYGTGHRGVDLAAAPGEPVRALAAGRITFAGEVAGIAVVSIDHDGWRSTYQPVLAEVEVGHQVDAGEVIGRTAPRGGHCAGHCMHLGVIAAGVYRDPLLLLAGPPVLKPRLPLAPGLSPRRAVRPGDAPG